MPPILLSVRRAVRYISLLSLLLVVCATANSQTNIALGKTVTSSSLLSGANPLSNLVDGDFNTYTSTTNNANQPNAEWLLVDLGADFFIDSVLIGCRATQHDHLRRFMIVTFPAALSALGNDPTLYATAAAATYNRLVYTDGSRVQFGADAPFGSTSSGANVVPGASGSFLGPDFPGSHQLGFNMGMHKARYVLLMNLQDEVLDPTELQIFTKKTSIRSIINGGFEQGSGLSSAGTEFVREGLVNGWNTTEAVGMNNTQATAPAQGSFIEFWYTGFDPDGGGALPTVPAYANNFFVELNAFTAGQLDQRQICVMAGESFIFSFAHRGRNGVDVMRLRINDADVAEMSDNNVTAGTHTATLLVSPTIATIVKGTTNADGWTDYLGTWTNTTGVNQLISFGFRAVSSNGSTTALSVGNFLDAASFSGLDPTVSFDKATGSGPETVPTTNLPKLYLIGKVNLPLTLELNITGGTATRGTDYTTTPASGIITMTVPTGEYDGTDATAVSLSPYIQISNDAVPEVHETIEMTIQTPQTGLKIADANICGAAISSAVYTIIDGTLPVKLTSFTAQKQNGSGLLKWHTATEVNTQIIVIEKSTGGILGFREIGRLAPTGDNSYYSFTDNGLLSGMNYYRLKIIDLDGKIDYSEVRVIKNNNNGNAEMQLFPNPANSLAKLILPAIGSNKAVIKLYNATGSLFQTINVANKQVVDIDLSKLPKGLYMIKYYDGVELFNKKVYKN